ncbi:betaine--homocysteine S-methyltransferase 1-like isoform X2 [Mizuhopecten yessoensis]|uniref:S-methylmethionine--homocysteine S-methyltransferase BHMT2 n=1 Tax=Mizuhopecten yessoensis TaxID=6573 RepID=A0A210PSQ2_MIZYE|nr:betaine--homocysteine S-methyltransferase 1-like isoform X1 [Mizuhopecten yessoensis]XP_021376109.1 betaine--homocysteine S-methyltransferase 1-like isoform X2 [Mizuhopecten yessoensis]OWF39508.1 S-methylmethionine--homocysteine S-methyltransferase BHMT2 [Mizuhopecten yessoensis]
MAAKGLLERLKSGENVVVAEGYLFEFERRGYLKAGSFIPEVVLEHPEKVKGLHEEFVHAGSDVVLAFTYYGHREKLRQCGRERDLEKLNVTALKIARQVADDTGTLMAGNICNSCVYEVGNPASIETTRNMFKEQIEWAVAGGADYIVAETFHNVGEALLALECIKEYGKVPAVITMGSSANGLSSDGFTHVEASRRLEEAGADVVGLNCTRGPATMMPFLGEIRQQCKGPIAALPVLYRTTPAQPTMQSLINPETGKYAFPSDLPAMACSRTAVREFARECLKIGVQYIGLCCGNSPHYIREVAEECGRSPPASRYSPNMSEHYIFGGNVKEYHAKTLLNEIRT